MNAGFAIDVAVLIGGSLLLIGVIASGLAERFRVPSLLLFLGLGMLVADEGLALIRFDDAALAQNIAAIALVVILFEGGLGTEPASFRRAGAPAALLATVGVVVTASVVAGAAWWLIGVEPVTALLLGAVIASTDAAAVFSALRTERLPMRTRDILQLESGMNDPVAVLLTIGMVEVWRGDPTGWTWASFLLAQLAIGLVVGVGVGAVARSLIGRLTGAAVSSLGVITLAIAAVSYGMASALGGSGFLAVYLTGAVIAGARRSSRRMLHFHEGLAATAQGTLFLLLGILVFPSELIGDIGTAVVVALVLIVVARPLAVFSVLVWSRTPLRRMALISWAGLRGAVPVVLATIPSTAGHPDGALIFDVAFVVVVLSVAVQAPTLGLVARRLALAADTPVTVKPEIVPIEPLDADLAEISVVDGSRVAGATLREQPLPGGARVAVVRRADVTIIPDGDLRLEDGDVLLVITPADCPLDDLAAWSAPVGVIDDPDAVGADEHGE
ncbi:MAG: potassium/proton antiporter [Ilumatobacter sp.]